MSETEEIRRRAQQMLQLRHTVIREQGRTYIKADLSDLSHNIANFTAGEIVAAFVKADDQDDKKRHRLHEAMAAIKHYLDNTDE